METFAGIYFILKWVIIEPRLDLVKGACVFIFYYSEPTYSFFKLKPENLHQNELE